MNAMSYQQPIYYPAPTNPAANTALTFGIIAACIGFWSWIPIVGLGAAIIGLPLAIVATATGHAARKRARNIGGVGESNALTAMTLGYIVIGLIAAVTLYWVIAAIVGAATR